ncbi:MAG: CHAT domain-containing protein [Planctomycetes bacterium]|nr:CHAT domain-containing protein [Planctomycetota bacterium]
MDIVRGLALLAGATLPGPQDSPQVVLDAPLSAVVASTDAIVSTAAIATTFADAPVRGRACRFTATQAGDYTIELSSLDFDAYLVVRRDDGSVLAEDDDGLALTDARAVVALAPAQSVTIVACALHGQVGTFELTVRRGRPPQQTAAARAAADIAAWQTRIRALEQRDGTDSAALIEPLNVLGVRLLQSGRFEEALAAQQRSLAICELRLGPGAFRTGFAHLQVAQPLSALRRHTEAERVARAGLVILESSTEEHRQREPILDEALVRLGQALAAQGRDAEAIDVYERLAERRFARLGEGHVSTRATLTELANIAKRSGQSSRLQRFLATLRSAAEGRPPADPEAALQEAGRLLLAGEPAAALVIAESTRRAEEPAGETPLLASALLMEGCALVRLGRAQDGELALRRAVELFERTEPAQSGFALSSLGEALFQRGALADSEVAMRRAVAAFAEHPGVPPAVMITARGNLATVLEKLGRARDALELRRQIVDVYRGLPDADPGRLDALLELGNAESALSNWPQATAAYREAVELTERSPDVPPLRRAQAMSSLARSLGERTSGDEPGLREEAETWFGRSLELSIATLGAEHPAVGESRAEWGDFLARTGRVAEGEREIRAGLAAARNGGSAAAIRSAERLLGQLLLNSGRAREAEPLLKSCAESLVREVGPDSFEVFGDLRMLTICFVQLANFAEARAVAGHARKLADATGDPMAAVQADELEVMAARGSATPREMEALLRGALQRAAAAGVDPGSFQVEAYQNHLATLLAESGRSAEAVPILRKLVAGAAARRGADDVLTARFRINLAHALANLRELGEARDLADRAVRTLEQIDGQPLWLADALVCVGTVDHLAGHDRAAVPNLRRALALREAYLPPEHPQLIQLWADLASTLDDEPVEAERYARRAVDAGERVLGAESTEVAQYLAVLAQQLANTERHGEAAALLRRALAILEARLGADHIDTCACALNLARVLGSLGDPEGARELLDVSLPRVERGLAAAPDQWRRLGRRVAQALETVGAFAEAESWVRRALEESEAEFGPDSPKLVADLKALGNLLFAQGRFRDAEASLRRALALVEAEEGPAAYALTGLLFDLAMLLDAEARTEEGLELMRRSLAIRQRHLGDEQPATLESLHSVAFLLGRAGRADEADRILDDVLAHDAARHLDPLFYARIVNLRALLRLALGAPDALDWARRAAAAAAIGPPNSMAVRIQANLALLEALRGERARARDAALEVCRSRIATAMPGIGRWSAQDRFFATAAARQFGDLLGHVTDLDDPLEVARAFETLSTTRGAAFRVDRTARLAQTAGDEALAGLGERLRRLAAGQSQLAFARDVADATDQARRLRALADEERRAELELLRRRPAEPGAWSVTAEQVRAALPERAALLAFTMLVPLELRHTPKDGAAPTSIPSRVLAFVVDANGTHGIDLGETAPLREATDAFLREIRSGPDGDASLRAARNDRLRRLLWEPLAPRLAGIDTVFVAPDTFLARLPLEVLADAQGRYLVESHAFVYTSDARSLVDQLASAPGDRRASRDLLVVGDVDYAARTGATPFVARAERGGFAWDWAPLPETARECDAVTELHASLGGAVELLRGAAATEEAVKASAGRFAVLHLATHGFFEPAGVPSLAEAAQRRVADEIGAVQAPGQVEPALEGHSPDLLSGLVLAGANRPQPDHEDGYLTAKEVGYLDLSTCELVVLSGCETGVGTSRGGEAMLGLRRAFHTAGARTVIASLWKVGDRATRELMTAFYRHLWQEGVSPATALRSAQIEMLSRQRNEGRVDPGAWGAFVLSGDAR